MFFREDSIFRGLDLWPNSELATFTMPTNMGAVVTIEPQSAEEAGKARKEGQSDPEDARASALIEISPEADIAAAFDALAERKLPKESRDKADWPRDFDFISADGQIADGHSVPLPALSKPVQDFIRDVQGELLDATRTAFGAVRWRLGIAGPHNPVRFTGGYWSFDGKHWESLPSSTTLSLSAHAVPQFHPDLQADIQHLLETGLREPLAHVLWREASEQRETNPRSAILVAIAALEVGIKQFAALRIPAAEWLLQESPTPPIIKMLKQFLPGLLPPEGGQAFERPASGLLRVVERGVELRNEIAHRGVEMPPKADVDDILDTIRTLLWKLDAATGLDWAEDYAE